MPYGDPPPLHLQWSTRSPSRLRTHCGSCYDESERERMLMIDDIMYCGNCVRAMTCCARCHYPTRRTYPGTNDRPVCRSCIVTGVGLMPCYGCSQYMLDASEHVSVDSRPYCAPCVDAAARCAVPDCGRPTVSGYRATGDRSVCSECVRVHAHVPGDTVLLACCRCNRFMPDQDERVQVGTSVACGACSLHAISCDGCNGRSMQSFRASRDRRVCTACVRGGRMRRCDQCQTHFDHHEVILQSTQNGYIVCPPCLAEQYRECDACEEFVSVYDNCETCNPYRDDDDYDCEYDGLVHCYSYTPELVFHAATGEDTQTYLGMELEVTNANMDCARAAIEALGDLGYLKEDSSVEYGFEIVTHPMTHAYACESFPWDLLNTLARNGAGNDEDSGIHVHVSRDGFSSQAHEYRWLKFIFRNEDGVSGIARRNGSTWARFSETARKDVKKYVDKNDRDRYDAQRYQAVNVQNRHTYEVRVFRSSLVRREVQAALDLVAASVEYTRKLSVREIVDGGWTWDAFRVWVSERPEYAALSEEMATCAC